MADKGRCYPSAEWVMDYGDGVELELYVGIRGNDFDEWIDRMPSAQDMKEMMTSLLIFIICTASKTASKDER